jgi:hypothetical protein
MKVYLAAFLIAFSILGSYYGLIDPQSPARRLSGESCRGGGSSTLDHGSAISISTGPASRLQEKRVLVNVAPANRSVPASTR